MAGDTAAALRGGRFYTGNGGRVNSSGDAGTDERVSLGCGRLADGLDKPRKNDSHRMGGAR